MATWQIPTLLALFSFGCWGLFTKLAVDHIDYKSALVFQSVGVLLVALFALILLNFKPMTNLKGVSFSVLTGAASSIGFLFYFLAADKGKINTIVTVTALYPLVTIILSFLLLQESINFRQFMGIGLALVSIYLLT